MKKKDLIEQLVSEIETGKVRTLGIYGTALQENQLLLKNCTNHWMLKR